MDGATATYYIVSGGVVTTTTTKTEIDRAPEGWQDYEISYERGWQYYGVYTAYSTPLKFMKDGAEILRHIMYTYGVEGNGLHLLVEKQDPSDWTFDEMFDGEVDMSKAQDEFDYIVAPIMQGGFIEKLKSREDTEYVYDLDNNADVVWVKHDGREMQGLIEWSFLTGGLDPYYQPDLLYLDTEGSNYYIKPQTQSKNPTSIFDNGFLAKSSGAPSQDVTFRLIYNFELQILGTVVGNSNLKIQIREVRLSDNTLITVHDYVTCANQAPSTVVTYSGDETLVLTVPSDRYLTMTFRLWNPTSGTFILATDYNLTINTSTLTGYFTNRFEATFIPTLPIGTVLAYLLEDINGAAINITDTLTSVYLNDQVVLTSGNGVRFLEGCKLTVTFKEVFNFLHSKFSASLTYNESTDTVYIGLRDAAFEDLLNGDIGTLQADDFTITPFTELMFTNLEIGSEEHDYDSKSSDENEVTNGKDEFNTLTKRLSPLTRMNGKTESYVSKIRCDMTGIELVRVNLGGKELADASSDNDVFALHINSASSGTEDIIIQGALTTVTYWTLYRKAINLTPGASYFEIENVFSPASVYNIIFSPLRSLLNNGTWFRSILKFSDAGSLSLQSTYKNTANNTKMIIFEGATPTEYNEGANVTISSLCAAGDVIFQPVRYKFKTKEDININSIIRTYPFRYIEFAFNGNTYNGYIIRVTSKPTWRGETEFELIAHRDDDLTNLIR
jgi:hypothetical protein